MLLLLLLCAGAYYHYYGVVQVDGGQWHGYWGVDRLWQVAGSPGGRHGDPPLPAAD